MEGMQNSPDEFSHFNFFSTLKFLALKLGARQCRCEEVRRTGGIEASDHLNERLKGSTRHTLKKWNHDNTELFWIILKDAVNSVKNTAVHKLT